MESSLRGFLLFVIFDISVFALSVFIWSSRRAKIISWIHTGFSKVYDISRKSAVYKSEPSDKSSGPNLEASKVPDFFSCTGSCNSYERNSVQFGMNSDLERSNLKSCTSQKRRSTFIDSKSGVIPEFRVTVPKSFERQTTNGDEPKTRWYHLMFGNANKITNNEAILYLRFMRDTFRMLLLCSSVSVFINGIVFSYLAFRNEKYFLWTYSIEDFLGCKATVWSLYATTWIYSFIVYVYILNFRSNVDKERQIAVILRPQLHTIMVTGFDKNITDPAFIYKHFEKYFPNQVLAVHMVMNHSKRMRLYDKLETAKNKLACLLDLSMDPPSHDQKIKSYPSLGSVNSIALAITKHASHTAGKGFHIPRTPKVGPLSAEEPPKNSERENTAPRRSTSCGDLTLKSRFGGITDIDTAGLQCTEERRPSKLQFCENEEKNAGSELFGQHARNKPEFSKQTKNIRKIKLLVDEEVNRPHTVSASISFVSFVDSNIVFHILKDHKISDAMSKWRIYPAPHPKDIIWSNLYIKRRFVVIRAILLNILLLSFYSAIMYMLSNANLLQTARDINKSSNTDLKGTLRIGNPSFWKGLIPPITMAIINSCVHPFLINRVSVYIGFWTQSAHQKYLLFGHTFYLIISTIFVPLGASMILFWKIFYGAFDSLSVELGGFLVNTSWRFVTVYILNAIFLGSSNQLLQTSQLLVRYTVQRIFKYNLGVYQFDFGYWYAFHLSILTLVMLFSIFIPYTLVLGALYFAVRYYIDRYNIAYNVWQIGMDSTGNVSAYAVRSMLVCISLTQFAMSGVFLNCQDVLPQICITMLYIASVATWLLMYESDSDEIMEMAKSLYSAKLKRLDKMMIDTVKVCYMHPCDRKDLFDLRMS